MNRPSIEVADIIRAIGRSFIDKHRSWLTELRLKVLSAIERCRTAALGGARRPQRSKYTMRLYRGLNCEVKGLFLRICAHDDLFHGSPKDHLLECRWAAVVLPDLSKALTGRVRMATEYAQRLGTPVIILHKRRESGTETTITRVVGDVGDRPCLIVDDMISTGGTIADSMEALLRAGARADITVAALMAYSWRALTQNSRVLRSGRFSSQIRSIAPGGPG